MLQKTEFASREKKCFQTNSEIFSCASVIFVAQTLFYIVILVWRTPHIIYFADNSMIVCLYHKCIS